MDTFHHRFAELFAQLGLPSANDDIRRFIDSHSPLSDSVRLEEAAFWTPAQAAMLKEALRDDANWSEVIDQLNLALRGRG